jgi:hypothetical protein
LLFAGGVGAAVHAQARAHAMAQAIVTADQSGQDITALQAKLAAYVHAHMLTDQTVFLSGSYNRAAAAAQAAANPNSNGTVYAQAQASCASHADSLVQARCVQAYLAANAQTGANPQAVAAPVKADYTKSYHAPHWTADLAGIMLLAAFAALAAAAALVSAGRL